jgi:pilus assembly protein CpaB
MNWKTWVPLVLAVVLGVVAAKVARDVIVRGRTAGISAAKFTKIVVAATDITPGRELKPENLALSQVEIDHVPSGSFTNVGDLQGRVTEQLMVKGQAVLEPMLAATGAGGGLQALVPTGMRAITVEVNEFSSVGGMITPGSRVDVISTIQGNNGDSVARTIVQNVKVTAVGQRTATVQSDPKTPADPSQEAFKSVTMLCTPEDAEAIELAASIGRPRLVLRSSRDTQLAQTDGITLAELRRGVIKGGSDPFVTPVVAPAPTSQPTGTWDDVQRRTVKVIRGGVETTVSMILEGNAAPPKQEDTATTDTKTETQKDLFD